MATTVDIGAGATAACPEIVKVAVQGGSVTIKNVAGATLSHYYGHNQGSSTGTTAQGASTTHSTTTFVQLLPTGRTTITLTGTGY